MKKLKTSQLLILIVSFLLLSRCSEKDEFKVPLTNDISFTPKAGDVITDINTVIAEYYQRGEIFTYEPLINSENSRYVSGYVISSDEAGNFFEQLIIQDKAANPTAGIAILIDENPLYTYYEFGRKVFIKLDGLSVSEENGVFKIGKREGHSIEKIPASLRNNHIIRDAEVADIIPLELAITDFASDKENLFIRLNDVQFHRDEVLGNRILTFASESTDEFNGERILEVCPNNHQVILSTSTFSDFKSLHLPINSGSIDGILTRDFFDDFYTLIINSPEDIHFSDDNRCDPITINCGLSDIEGDTILFEDDFESQTRNALISGNGWTNFIEKGKVGFEAYKSSGSNASLGISARIGSFNSGDDSNIAWLISPLIDLNNHSNVALSFQTSNSFADKSDFLVLYSNDWNGNPANVTSSTWAVLTAANIVQDSDNFSLWIHSGLIDISCGSGRFYIAFKYIGNGSTDYDGTYELDAIKITAN